MGSLSDPKHSILSKLSLEHTNLIENLAEAEESVSDELRLFCGILRDCEVTSHEFHD